MSNFTWTTGASGNWAVPGNWSPAGVPDADTDIAVLPGTTGPDGYAVTIDPADAEIVNGLTLGDLVIGHGRPTLTVGGTLSFGGSNARMAFLSGDLHVADGGVLDGAGQLGTTQGPGPLTIVNDGTVHANGGSGSLLAILTGFINNGTVLADDGTVGLEGAAGVANLAGTTLTGGTWIAQGPTAGTFNQIVLGFNFDAVIATNAATIVLDGAASRISGFAAGQFQPLEQQLQTIAAAGSLRLLNGRGYSTALALRDDGVIALQGGTFASGGLTVGEAGTFSGAGLIDGAVANQGIIAANGGALLVSQAISGSGNLVVASGDRLILNGATPTSLTNNGTVYAASGLLRVAALLSGGGTLVVQNGATAEIANATTQDVRFSGSRATLRLDDHAGFQGTLGNFAQGDTLLLADTVATDAFVSGGTLVVRNAGATVDTFALDGSYAADAVFRVSAAGGDVAITNLTGAPIQQDVAFVLLPVNDLAEVDPATEAQIVADLDAAMRDWAQYLTGHAALRIQLNIVPGQQGAELANASPTINIASGTTLDGRQLDIPSSLIALNTGTYVAGTLSDITINLFAGNLGSIYVNPAPTPESDGSVPAGLFDLVTVFRHELAHGFGFGGLTTPGGVLGSQETLFDHYIQTINGTVVFTGPTASAAYGALLGTGTATPVPLTTLANGEGFAHFANSTLDVNATDLMSGLGLPPATQRDISMMDLAVLKDVGAPVTAGLQPLASLPRILLWSGRAGANAAIAQNWDDATNALDPAMAAPGSLDTALFLAGGGAIAGSLPNVATLEFTGSDPWTVGSSALLRASGAVTVSATTLTVGGAASIGGQGADRIADGAIVVVSDKGTAWDSAGTLTIGGQGSGTLRVVNGATASAGQTSLVTTLAGDGDGGDGVLQVDGGLFTAFGELDIGESGTGSVLVQNQGTLRTSGLAGGTGRGFVLASGPGGRGVATVAGDRSLLSSSGGMVVGAAGIGMLLIQNGGSVVTAPGTLPGVVAAVVADVTAADGSSVNVTGAGSNWRIDGDLTVGRGGHGSLAITAGGTVTAGALTQGAGDGGAGDGGAGIVSVVGAGSRLALEGSLVVGLAASAGLAILNGATVSAARADIGGGAGGTGNVDIEGAGSHLQIASDLDIGVAGVGVLTLGGGTELTVASSLNIGATGVLNQFGGIIDPEVVSNQGRIGGSGAIEATVSFVNDGTLYAIGGSETVTTPLLTGSGVLEIDAGGTLVLNAGSVAATQTVIFADATGVLSIGRLSGFAATIGRFQAGDAIEVQDASVAATSFDPVAHVLTLFDASHAVAGALRFGETVTDGAAIRVNGVAPCFAGGTRIATERGPVAVEDLRVGDRVWVLPGQAVPVTWIGHRRVDCARHPAPRRVWPVRVAAHAFGAGRPERDLYLSPDHALYVDEVLIPVKSLVNGTTVAQVVRRSVRYYHVELPRHAILLAENLAAESYLDTGDRSGFANGGGAVALHPDFASRVWEAQGCAPLVVAGPTLAAARARLAALRVHVDEYTARRAI